MDITTPHLQGGHGYPRPQLVRAHWQTLNGPWAFTFDNEGIYTHPQHLSHWPLTIEVPFAPECPQSGIGQEGYHKRCWYQRHFSLHQPPRDISGARVHLHFGAVDYEAHVWVNELFIGSHSGGYTPFFWDITEALQGQASTHTLTVLVTDDPLDLTKPRGKQDWELLPHSIWYPRTTGIWQTVWLEVVPPIHIQSLTWFPHTSQWEVGFEASVSPIDDNTQPYFLMVTLTHGTHILAQDKCLVVGGEVNRRFGLSDPGPDDSRNALLWSPENPTLLGAQVTLWCGDTCLDEVQSYTALRSVGCRGGHFTLNGKPYYLRMVLNQGYWPQSHLTAPNDDAFRGDIELIKAMGFNGVRLHQKIESPRFLYWADVLGLVVWEEMPSAYRFTPLAVQRLTTQWMEVLQRDKSHPCVVVWVPLNESWGVPSLDNTPSQCQWVLGLYHLTKSLDPYRLVVGNDGWESAHTDVATIHDYEGEPARLARRYGREPQVFFAKETPAGRALFLEGYSHQGQPVVLSEFGGLHFVGAESGPSSLGWGYTVLVGPQEFQLRFQKLLDAVLASPFLAGFCYTQFTDTFQEANGLLFSSRAPKIPLNTIASAVKAPVTGT